MRIFLNLALTLVLCTQSVLAQQTKPRSDSELEAITARGRMLADYDAASRYATEAMVGLKPAQGVVARYIARKSDGRWVVAGGRFNETKDAFLIVYQATQGGSPEQFSVKTYDPPKNDTGFFFTAAKGIQISLESSHLEKRPYNTYVLPLPVNCIRLFWKTSMRLHQTRKPSPVITRMYSLTCRKTRMSFTY